MEVRSSKLGVYRTGDHRISTDRLIVGARTNGGKGFIYNNPNFPALFSQNKLPSRMYRLTICMLRCAVWFMMLRSDAA